MKRQVSILLACLFLLGSVYCGSEKDQVAAKIRQIVAEVTGGEGKVVELEISDTSLKMDGEGSGVTEVRPGGDAAYVASIILDYKGSMANIIVAINRDKTSGELDYSSLRSALGSY